MDTNNNLKKENKMFIIFISGLLFALIQVSPAHAFVESFLFKEDANIIDFTRTLIRKDLYKRNEFKNGKQKIWIRPKIVKNSLKK